MKDIHNDTIGQSEDALQQKCCFWMWNKYPRARGLLFSVPNGGSRDVREVKKLKATGLTPGVSDLIFLYNTRVYFIELKTEKGYQNAVQRDWQAKVESQGFNYFIVRNLKDFKSLIETLIKVA